MMSILENEIRFKPEEGNYRGKRLLKSDRFHKYSKIIAFLGTTEPGDLQE
jgi:hypothetical protein